MINIYTGKGWANFDFYNIITIGKILEVPDSFLFVQNLNKKIVLTTST